MSKTNFIVMILKSFGYSEIEVKTHRTGTNGGQSEDCIIWSVKAFKKDAAGDIDLAFSEQTFELFIYHLTKYLHRL